MEHDHAIETEVFRIIRETLHAPDMPLSSALSLAELSSDSIQLFELLTAFERAYNTKTTYEDIVAMRTVGDIVSYVTHLKHHDA